MRLPVGLLLVLVVLTACGPHFSKVAMTDAPGGGVHPFVEQVRLGEILSMVLKDGTELYGTYSGVAGGFILLEDTSVRTGIRNFIGRDNRKVAIEDVVEIWIPEQKGPSPVALGFSFGFVIIFVELLF